MKHRVLFCLFLLLTGACLRLCAQAPDISSLEKSLADARGKERVNLLNQLADRLERSESKEARDYAREAYRLSGDLNYPQGLIPSAYHLGFYDRQAGRYTRAVRYTEAGIEAARSIGDRTLLLLGLEQLAGIYQVSGQRKELAETKLAYTRLKSDLNDEKNTAELAIIQDDLAANEAALNRSESEKAEITDVLNQTVEEKLRQEARAARLAQEKAELETQTAILKRQAAEDALEISEQEKALLEYEKMLQRKQFEKTIAYMSLAAALVFIVFIILYFRQRRIRIEEKNAAQRQLLKQEKMATLGQLTAGIAHEIKNPLNFVNNFAEGSAELTGELAEAIAHNRTSLPADQYELFDQLAGELKQNAADIHSHGQRADRIVRSMMDHARGDTGVRQPVSINSLIGENLQLAYHGFWARHPDFQVDLDEQYDPSLQTIQAIPTELSRVFLNIFNNACEALYQKQTAAGAPFSPTLSVISEKRGDKAIVWIRDNGPGIPSGVSDQIFTPFFTTKPTGEGHTGLGLSISYDIVVEGHGGTLAVQSEPDAFTEFIIQLPIGG